MVSKLTHYPGAPPFQCELNDCTAAFSSSKISNRFNTPINFNVCTTNFEA